MNKADTRVLLLVSGVSTPGHTPRHQLTLPGHQKIFWRGSHAQGPRMNTLFMITVLSTREPRILAWKISAACLIKSLTSNNSPVYYELLYLNLKNGDVPTQNE